MAAATQVVMFLLRKGWRVELVLLQHRFGEESRRDPPSDPILVLLVAATVAMPADPNARLEFERELRAAIERRYTRQGVTPVYYDLQLL
jgi:hypothetical protein